MTYHELLKDIRERRFAPVYFLHGEETYFTDAIADAIEAKALSEAERGFNQTILYGKDIDAIVLLDYLRRYPMMSERQVVILREAQEMKTLPDLVAYMTNPMETTLFVVCYKHKKYDMSTKFGKALKGKTVVFESKKLYDNQLPDWISDYCQQKKLKPEPAATNLLAEYLGTDLAKVANEIDKLALNLPPGSTVTTVHIQEYVGISKDYNVYELQKAFALRDLPKIAMIQQYFSANIRKNPLIVTISSLYGFFSKVYALHFLKNASEAEKLKALELRSEWFLRDYAAAAQRYSYPQVCQILSILRDYDLRAKGIDTDLTSIGEEGLMQEMFFKMIH
jgi:DNA polymerase III subunit delta